MVKTTPTSTMVATAADHRTAVACACARTCQSRHGLPAPTSMPSATPTRRPIACESLPRYAREGSSPGETSAAIQIVDASAPPSATTAHATGLRTSSGRVQNTMIGKTT